MKKITDKFHVVEINRESGHVPENLLKIDGKAIEGIQNVKIEYGIGEPYPIITIEFLAKKLISTIKTEKIGLLKEIQ